MLVYKKKNELSYCQEEEIKSLLLFRKITKVTETELLLDNGIKLEIIPNEGCPGCGAGSYDITELNDCDNAITNIEFECVDEDNTIYRIFVFAEDIKIKLVELEGDDGSGYNIQVKIPFNCNILEEYKYEYDDNGNLILAEHLAPEYIIIKIEYDSDNRITKSIYPNGTVCTWEYEGLTEKRYRNGEHLETLKFDDKNNLIGRDIIYNKLSISKIYDDKDNLIREEILVGKDYSKVYEYIYDDKNREIWNNEGGIITETTYDGDKVQVNSSDNFTSNAILNIFGKKVEYEDSTGLKYNVDYDTYGNPIYYKDNEGFESWAKYSNRKLCKYHDSDGTEINIEYDKHWRLIHYTKVQLTNLQS